MRQLSKNVLGGSFATVILFANSFMPQLASAQPEEPSSNAKITAVAPSSAVQKFRLESPSYFNEINGAIAIARSQSADCDLFQQPKESEEQRNFRMRATAELAYAYYIVDNEALQTGDSNKPSQSLQNIRVGLANDVSNKNLPLLDRQQAFESLMILSLVKINAPDQDTLKACIVAENGQGDKEWRARSEALYLARGACHDLSQTMHGLFTDHLKVAQNCIGIIDENGSAYLILSLRHVDKIPSQYQDNAINGCNILEKAFAFAHGKSPSVSNTRSPS